MARYQYNEAATVPAINAELEKIETAINDTLSRKGDTPNSMETDLDMNSFRVYNLPDPVSASEPMTKRFGDSVIAEATAQADRAEDEADAAQQAKEDAEDQAFQAQQSANTAIANAAMSSRTEGKIANLSNLKELGAINNPKEGETFSVLGFYAGVIADMGLLVWDSTADKTLHNLIDYIDPDRINAWNGTQADLATLKTAAVSGTGCFRRVYDGWLNAEWAGLTNTTAEQSVATATLFEVGNRNIFFKKTALPIVTDVMLPEDNTNIFLQAGVEFHAIDGGTRVYQLQGKNISIQGYGAKTYMNGTQGSHNIYVNRAAENIYVAGLEVEGSGNSGDDCIYLGGDPLSGEIPKNIHFKDVDAHHPVSRNVLSVVACDGYVFEDCKFHGATQSIACGVDIEANTYMTDGSCPTKNGVFIRCDAYDNDGQGFAVIFGDDVKHYNCRAWGNGGSGFVTSAGGSQFNDTVFREGDRLGVSSFDLATGFITVRDTGGNLRDLGIEVGNPITKIKKNGAVWPAEIESLTTRIFINEISADGLSFRVGVTPLYGTITSLSDAGTGVRSFDPLLSDLEFYVNREGQASNIWWIDCESWGNGADSQIRPQTGVNLYTIGCKVPQYKAGIGGLAISASHTKNNVIRDCVIDGGGIVGTRGIASSTCYPNVVDSNQVFRTALEGITVSGKDSVVTNNLVVDCGFVSGRPLRLQNGSNMRCTGNRVYNKQYPTTRGIMAESTCTTSLIADNNCEGAAGTNANSIVANGAGNVLRDNIQRDGTFRP